MNKLLLPALVALLQLMSSAFTASVPSPFTLPVNQSSNSTVDLNECLAEGSNSTLTPSLKFVFYDLDRLSRLLTLQ